METRIKKLRKALELTQQEFAERIGIKRNTVATYEIGRNVPLDAVIASMCREFNVNEAWLRTGEGEMFHKRSREDELTAYMNSLLQSEPDDIRRRFATAVSHLSTQQLEILEGIALQLVEGLQAPEPQTTSTAPQNQLPELVGKSAAVSESDEDEDAAIKAEARKKADAYYEQLLLEAGTRTSGASTPAKAG